MNSSKYVLLAKFFFGVCALLALAGPLKAESRILDVKTGYCITVQVPANLAGARCYSQVYYYRESDQNIYICGVSVGGPPPGSAIDKAPSEIGCYPLGKSPVNGTISMRSLGDRLITKEYIASGNLQDSMFSWRGAYWLVSDQKDSLAFCVWDDTPAKPVVACTDKIDWSKFVGSGGVGSQ